MKKAMLFFCFGLFLTGCGKEKSNREIFDQEFEKNLEACISAMVKAGDESTYAKEMCTCALNKAYEADSTVITMSQQDLAELLRVNHILESCDSTVMQNLTIRQ